MCAAPFTGGLSLGMCAACTGLGFVAGSVIDKVSEEGSRQVSQASPEAYNLLGKSIEEMNKTIKSLEEKINHLEEENRKLKDQQNGQLTAQIEVKETKR